VKPALVPVTLTVTFFSKSAPVREYVRLLAFEIAVAPRYHWYVTTTPESQVPVTAVRVDPTDGVPVIVGTGVNVSGALDVVEVTELVRETEL
jgi:hypothetical protein